MRVMARIPRPPRRPGPPQAITLTWFTRRRLAVVNKPAGMVVHPAAGHYEGTLVNALLARYPIWRSAMRGDQIVHRLDRIVGPHRRHQKPSCAGLSACSVSGPPGEKDLPGAGPRPTAKPEGIVEFRLVATRAAQAHGGRRRRAPARNRIRVWKTGRIIACCRCRWRRAYHQNPVHLAWLGCRWSAMG